VTVLGAQIIIFPIISWNISFNLKLHPTFDKNTPSSSIFSTTTLYYRQYSDFAKISIPSEDELKCGLRINLRPRQPQNLTYFSFGFERKFAYRVIARFG
jgi:hypothetical protein